MMSKKKVNSFDIAIKYVLLLFSILLMAVLVYVIFSGEISLFNKVLGSGISVFGIVGTVMIAIFKSELDKAESPEERSKIMELLIKIFNNLKP